MKGLAAILAVAIIGLAWLAQRQQASIQTLQQDFRELAAKLVERDKTASLEMQEKCSRQAEHVLSISGFKDGLAGQENHYNANLNRCFVQVGHTSVGGRSLTGYKALSDAFEGKLFGELSWLSGPNRVLLCQVTMPDGRQQRCTSQEEYEELTKTYMQ
jgi:hypothetical protein